MTIEEYLRSEISGRKSRQLADGWMMTDHAYEYHEGYIAALEEILSKLSSFDHEVTLREVKEECRVHKRESKEFNVCKGCALYFYEECLMKVPPRYLKTDEIQKRMKEARND